MRERGSFKFLCPGPGPVSVPVFTQSKYTRVSLSKIVHIYDIPLEDVLHETIMPMLDYESRINFNRCLPPHERYRARWTKNDCIGHELYVAKNCFLHKINRILSLHGNTKTHIQKRSKMIVQMIEFFDTGKRGFFLLENFPKVHASFLCKLKTLLDENDDSLNGATPYFKSKIRKLSQQVLTKLEKVSPVLNPAIHLTPIQKCGNPVFL